MNSKSLPNHPVWSPSRRLLCWKQAIRSVMRSGTTENENKIHKVEHNKNDIKTHSHMHIAHEVKSNSLTVQQLRTVVQWEEARQSNTTCIQIQTKYERHTAAAAAAVRTTCTWYNWQKWRDNRNRCDIFRCEKVSSSFALVFRIQVAENCSAFYIRPIFIFSHLSVFFWMIKHTRRTPHIERCHCIAHTTCIEQFKKFKCILTYTHTYTYIHIYHGCFGCTLIHIYLEIYNAKMCNVCERSQSESSKCKILEKMLVRLWWCEIVWGMEMKIEISNFENQPNIDRDRHERIHSTAFNTTDGIDEMPPFSFNIYLHTKLKRFHKMTNTTHSIQKLLLYYCAIKRQRRNEEIIENEIKWCGRNITQ